MKSKAALLVTIVVSFLLTGCMYPEERKAENQVPYEDQIISVQNAVEKYQEDEGGLLPIKTRDEDTPIYIKYPIDFKKLQPKYIPEPPGNAYESGGVFQYVLVDVETNPTVKVFDLRIAEKIREIKIRIRSQGYPPFKNSITKSIFTLDYSKLGYDSEPYVISPFTQNNLSFVITGSGEIYVDYISDLYHALQESEESFQPGENIINLLTKDSYFVPAYSLPYTVDKNNEPIYLE
ncbi:MAG TPA: hypothetical protein VKZ77_09115 [Bacillaceae bacterium]|nr:hypothetical protein [Paenibacillus bovis]HLU22634.1 hypothetical protein [Bacillaceae bacterium]